MGEALARIATEIEADRETLIRLMERLGIERKMVKPALAKVAERLGRFKLNGQLRGYSPLSRVLELEVLASGIGGKMQLWNAFEQSFGESLDGFDFHALAERADRQGRQVEDLHLAAAQRALPSATSSNQGVSGDAHRDRPLGGDGLGGSLLLAEDRLGHRDGLAVAGAARNPEQQLVGGHLEVLDRVGEAGELGRGIGLGGEEDAPVEGAEAERGVLQRRGRGAAVVEAALDPPQVPVGLLEVLGESRPQSVGEVHLLPFSSSFFDWPSSAWTSAR